MTQRYLPLVLTFTWETMCFFTEKSSFLPCQFVKNDPIFKILLLSYRSSFKSELTSKHWDFYSCNKIFKTWIQIFRQNWFGFFSNISHQIFYLSITPIVSTPKSNWYKHQKLTKIPLDLQLRQVKFWRMVFRWSFCIFLVLLLLWPWLFFSN